MKSFRYTKGLHDLGNGLHAWLLPDGSWGWSNAGLIEDSGQTLLVDTLFDLQRTREMLDAMRDAVPAASDIGMLVNTHGNGDHTFGNQLLEGKRIIAAAGCAEDMKHRPPEQLAQWQRDWRSITSRIRFVFVGIHSSKSRYFREVTLSLGLKYFSFKRSSATLSMLSMKGRADKG